MRGRFSIVSLSFVFALLLAVLMARVAFSAAVPHRTVEMTPVAAEGDLAKELGRYGMTAWRTTNKGPKFSCLAYTPPNAGRKRIPLVVYIPGKGEIGPDLLKQFNQRTLFNLVTSQKFQSRHPCHLLALSPPAEATTLVGGGLGCPSRVQQMLRAIVSWMESNAAAPKVDASRIYLVGFSYGGDGVYALANHYPGEFAAAVPISSGCPHPEYVSESSPGNWWHVYNELDFAGCERMFAELNAFKDRVNALGGDFRMGTYPKAGHDAWTAAWREDELWDWMFSKSTAHGALSFPRRGVECFCNAAWGTCAGLRFLFFSVATSDLRCRRECICKRSAPSKRSAARVSVGARRRYVGHSWGAIAREKGSCRMFRRAAGGSRPPGL